MLSGRLPSGDACTDPLAPSAGRKFFRRAWRDPPFEIGKLLAPKVSMRSLSRHLFANRSAVERELFCAAAVWIACERSRRLHVRPQKAPFFARAGAVPCRAPRRAAVGARP